VPINKAQGTTASERYLAALGEKSFLGLWSYANLYRKPAKELCDLLVVSGEDVVIFSDKSCAFPNTGDINVDWQRWYKSSITESMNQVFGAERWIKLHPDRIFLDARCHHKFPFEFRDPAKIRFHRVIVALGAKDRCAKYTGGSGSLILCPDVTGDDHARATNPPFTLLGSDPGRKSSGYVHVFDEVTLDIVLKELDTVTDFLRYLRKKEALFEKTQLAFAGGEQELLAIYLQNVNDRHEHDFAPVLKRAAPDGTPGKLVVKWGSWEAHQRNPQVAAKEHADKISYFWDEIIARFTGHALTDTLTPESAGLVGTELSLRIMSREDRFARRIMSRFFLDFAHGLPSGQLGSRMFRNPDSQDVLYVFMVVPFSSTMTAEDYRAFRRHRLEAYCTVLSSKHRDYKVIVGIATEEFHAKLRSYDLIHIPQREWTPKDEAYVADLQKRWKFFAQTRQTRVHADEYPQVIPHHPKREKKRRGVRKVGHRRNRNRKK
jgi:hypothetical protein